MAHVTAAKIDLDQLETTPLFECYFCDFRNHKKSTVTRHESGHNQKTFYQPNRKSYKCDICFSELTSKSSLETHKLAHSGEKPFACNECEFRSNQRSNLNTHIKSNHRERIFVQCEVCGTKLLKVSLKSHKKLHIEEELQKMQKCDVCGKILKWNSVKSHEKLHQEKKFARNFCEFQCHTNATLKNHLRRHTGEKPYECKKCDYRGRTKGELSLHMRVHDDVKPFQCEICFKKFRQSTHHRTHMKMHLGIKPLKCQMCEYHTASPQSLRFHEATHFKDKEAMFKCHLCEQTFNWRHHFKTHMATHRGVKNRVQCPFCDMTFSLKQSIKVHIRRMHRELSNDQLDDKSFKCKLCKYETPHKENFRDHMSRTHGDRKFGCNFCSKRFKCKKRLEIHLVTHTNESPFECRFCDFRANQNGNLWTHEKQAHGEELEMTE